MTLKNQDEFHTELVELLAGCGIALVLVEKFPNTNVIGATQWINKGQEIAVIIPKSGEKVKVLAQKDGITEQEAKEKIAQAHPEVQIEKASLGMYDNQAVWEVVGKNSKDQFNYYLLSFESGKEIKTITGI